MEYIKATWKHDLSDQPVLFYSELGHDRFEIRKIEIYRDNKFGLADIDFEYGGSALGLMPVPSLEEINSEPQFSAQEISKEEFDFMWDKYIGLLKRIK